MIKPQRDWIFFRIQKITDIGRIALPDAMHLEKEDVIVLGVGPDVKNIKKGMKIILHPRNVVQHLDPEVSEKETRGFVQEENVIAIVSNEK